MKYLSVTKAFNIYTKNHIVYFRLHKHADSLFSTASGFTNYRGLLNLCILLLVSFEMFPAIYCIGIIGKGNFT